MQSVANRWEGRLVVNSKLLSWLSLVLFFAGLFSAHRADAEDLKSNAALIADQSFG
jgi:hypothetical protein